MWITLAIFASLTWGLMYVISEQIYKEISVFTSLALSMTISGIIVGLAAFALGVFGKDMSAIFSSPRLFWLVVLETVALVAAELFIGFSIVGKNATLAGLIEISYPLFIALFSYLLFRESSLTFATAIGGALIFSGVVVIYFFSR